MPTISVQGMNCDHCKKAVTDAIGKLPGIASVSVDLQKAEAHWVDANPATPVNSEVVKEAVRRTGFTAP